MLLRYALRNLSRHRVRTVLTTLAVGLSVGLVMMGSTFLNGLNENVMGEFTRQSGHVRLRNPGYEKEARFDPLDWNVHGWRALRDRALAVSGVERAHARLLLRVMLQHTDESTIVPESAGIDEDELTDEQIFGRKTIELAAAVGVEPGPEKETSKVDDQLLSGRWFTSEDAHEVLIGVELARRLGVKAGDGLELVSYRNGVSDAEVTVAGIFDTGNRYANRTCYLPIGMAEALLDMPDQATELLVFGHGLREAQQVLDGLNAAGVTDGLEAKLWNEISLVKTMVKLFDFIIGLMLAAIIIVAAVGLLNTMLMTVLERQREIGVLLALGLSRGRVVGAFVLEALLFAVAGCLVGGAGGLAGSLYFVEHGMQLGQGTARNMPIAVQDTIYGVLTPSSVVWAVGIGLVVALLGAFWPSLRASSVQPIDAMRRT